MLTKERPLRSWMFVPGNRQRFIDKSRGLDVDAIFLDIEDGVPPAEKGLARKQIAAALAEPAEGPVRFVRVNAAGSDWHEEDLEWVLTPGLDGLCLPKVEDPDTVRAAATLLAETEAGHGIPDGTLRIVAAIESAAGLLRAAEIATAHPRMVGLMLGAEDYALDLGLGTRREREARELIYARSSMVVAAAYGKIIAIDGVFPDLDDEEGLLADVTQARRLGFKGKSLFHPSQIGVINRLFSPSEDEIEYARKVVQAFDEATLRGDGAVAVGGQLVDLPIVLRAERLLASLEFLGPDGGSTAGSVAAGEAGS